MCVLILSFFKINPLGLKVNRIKVPIHVMTNMTERGLGHAFRVVYKMALPFKIFDTKCAIFYFTSYYFICIISAFILFFHFI